MQFTESEKKVLEIKAIKEKVELEDVQLQVDPCKNMGWGRFDCLIDCADYSPKQSGAY